MGWGKGILLLCVLSGLILAGSKSAFGQGSSDGATPQDDPQQINIAMVGKMIQQLQSQVQDLTIQVKTLKEQQQLALAESAELREELQATRSQLVSQFARAPGATSPTGAQGNAPETSIEDRMAKLEENQQLADEKAAEQNQTKVESSSKYSLRLSGIVLLNTYVNRGSVDNQDFPQIATAPMTLSSNGTFGGSLRQSQIGLQGFGPTVAGARTSAEVRFDFAGGFPNAPNGTSFGIMRLRTGTVRFDWGNTSVIAGQDSLFIAPLSPTSIATVAIPAFAYSGELWSWTPQVRLEQHFNVGEHSAVLLQAGLLDSLSGDRPLSNYYRYPTMGENSGQPAYAARLAWTQAMGSQKVTMGAGGYYGRQSWGFNRSIDGWAGTADLTLPLGDRLEFTGQFYRGRATGGLSGGIGQSALWNGDLLDPATDLYGLNSMGGWAQLKYKATPKLQLNGAFGQDNPFAADLRQFGGNKTYYPSPLSRNQSVMGNFLYQPRSDLILSLEYRRILTGILDSQTHSANIIITSVGFLF